jgi:hypothetical protein
MKKRLPIVLFLTSLVVFNLNLRLIGCGDTIPASLLPFAVVIDHRVCLDRYYSYYSNNFPDHPYFFTFSRNHAYSTYPIALPLLVSPLYVPVVSLLHMQSWPVERIVPVAVAMEKLVASLIAALSVTIFYSLLKRLTSYRAALLYTLLFAFGTETWTISSQALWQHGAGALMIICSLFFLNEATEEFPNCRALFMAGLFAALSAAIRPSNVVFAAAAVAYLLCRRERLRTLFVYSLAPAVLLSGVAIYNFRVFGDLRGNPAYQVSIYFDGLTSLRNAAGLFISPGRGLFIYTPALVVSLAGIFLALRRWGRNLPPVYAVSLLFVILHTTVFGLCPFWHGGWSYGPRYMTEIVPALILFLIPATTLLYQTAVLRGAFACACLFSVFTQGVGAFCWPYGYPYGSWDATPINFMLKPDRLWDWKDNPILRTARAGILKDSFRELYQRPALPPVTLFDTWEDGFFGRESADGVNWRWCKGQGCLRITNLTQINKNLTLDLKCTPGRPDPCNLRIDSPWFSERLTISEQTPVHLVREIVLLPGESKVQFSCDGRPLEEPSDSRTMVFRVWNATVREHD